ncbi:hypothetical protein CANTEDRAFT_110260 [Yamadazyma tenuis ATCC 10573]|uniref:Histone transcription regulator 3 homolog n=2 Tax=Candida tenuis TaxID=2315449 RepID=G3BFM1_CANTC|nr:uncharacterized protein CANTEDRAFT_110260 [Yamadazyma tenuis ATCC 10573]EGV60052.1 hypothetical protein CANTEDRAFT_110260 [Yamadazyma tenuis ATCC 10573]
MLFYTLVDDMGNALIYQEADSLLIDTLYEVLVFMGSARLARFILEYSLSSKAESNDILGLLPLDKVAVRHHEQLVDRINQRQTGSGSFTKHQQAIEDKYSFLAPLRADFQASIDKVSTARTMNCKIKIKGDVLKWEHVTSSINEMLKAHEDKSRIETTVRSKLKDIDTYCFTANSIEILHLEVPEISDEVDDAEEESTSEGDASKQVEEDHIHEPTDLQESEAAPSEEISTEVEKAAGESPALDHEGGSVPPTDTINETHEEGNPETSKSTPKSISKGIQRASKRLQKSELEFSYLPNLDVTPAMFSETTRFFSDINTFLSKLNVGESLSLGDIASKFVDPGDITNFTTDFIDVLDLYEPSIHAKALMEAWRLRQSRLKDTTDHENEKLKLLEVLKSFSSTTKSSTELNNGFDEQGDIYSPEIIADFITKANDKKCHINDIKISILRFLMGNQKNGLCLICDTHWSDNLLHDVKGWVNQLELQLLQESENALKLPTTPTLLDELTFSTSVFELLVDTYVDQKSKVDLLISQNADRGFQKSLKASLNTQISVVTKLKSILERWILHLEGILYILKDSVYTTLVSFKSFVRFQWSMAYKERSDNANFRLSKFLTARLSQLSELLESKPGFDVAVKMANYKCIKDISSRSIYLLSNTITVTTVFAKILYAKDGDNNEEAISILERTLIGSEYFNDGIDGVDSSAISSVKALLQESSTDMKFSLWTILFSYYNYSSNLERFQFGFERVLESILIDLDSDTYKKEEIDNRASTLLKILSLFDEYLTMFLDHLSKNAWKLTYNSDKMSSYKETLKRLLVVFQLLYMFSLHEEAALITSKKITLYEKSRMAYNKFKGFIMRLTTAIVLYYDLLVKGDYTARIADISLDLLSLFHDQLGNRRLCDSGDGIFLLFYQDVILQSDSTNRQSDILQLLSCRHHWNISSNNFTPVNHDTSAATQLNKDSAFSISKLVLPLCLSRQPIVNPPKGDLKSIIDEFYEVIGDPIFETLSPLDQNNNILSHVLDDTVVSGALVKECFYGLRKINFLSPGKSELTEIAQGGLYYLQGLLVFSSYKVRKKSMQGRSLELENVIKLLKNDLVYASNRVESWLLLGQAYGFLVEDDLIWTPDKLTAMEKKIATANLQRKSLICYLMAINFSKEAPPNNLKAIIGELMSSFAIEMFNACMIPMLMMAFKVTANPKFVHTRDENKFVTVQDNPPIRRSFCFKIIQQSLHLAIKSNSQDWINYYYLSKVQGKLKLPMEMIMETLIDACHHSSNVSTPELILEPHYRICSVAFKAIKRNQLLPKSAVEYLLKDSLFKEIQAPSFETDNQKREGYEFVVECLKKIAQTDRKRWHHKYHYRLAKIYFEELDNIKAAIEEMSIIVSLKATSKTLVSIWKPDIERPGKHFYYTSQYVLLYIDLLYADKNLVGLFAMVPRLRRSSTIMVSLFATWEKLCSVICKLVRYLYDVKETFTESFLHTPIHLFFNHVQQINMNLKGKELPESLQPALCLLNVLNELKKLNSGFGPTSLIDDTIVAVFVNVYYQIQADTAVTSQVESPKGNKRLAKKDIFPCVSDILKNCKREVDALVKNSPDLLNEFALKKQQEFDQRDLEKQNTPVPQKVAIIVTPPTADINPEDVQLSSQSVEYHSAPSAPATPTPVPVPVQSPLKRLVEQDEPDEPKKPRVV